MNTSTDNHPPQALPFRRTGLLHFGIGLAAFALLGLASFRVFGSEWMFLAVMTLPAFAWIALKSITYRRRGHGAVGGSVAFERRPRKRKKALRATSSGVGAARGFARAWRGTSLGVVGRGLVRERGSR